MRVDHYRESVWNARDLTATEKLVLVAMTRWMDRSTLGDCRPGHAALQRRMSLSKRTLERTIASVIRKGWLVEDHHGGARQGAKREASIYRGRLPDWRHSDASPNGSTGVMVSKDWRHSDAPPSQGPGAPERAGAQGTRPRARKRASRVGDPSTNGATPCADRALGCDGLWHTLTDPVELCPRRRTA